MKHKNIWIFLLLFGIIIFIFLRLNIRMISLSADSGLNSSYVNLNEEENNISEYDKSNITYIGQSNNKEEIVKHNFIVYTNIRIFVITIMGMLIAGSIAYDIYKQTSFKEDKVLYEDDEALENIKNEIKAFNKDEFYKYVYNSFVKLQESWTKFDYEALKPILTDDLYKQYELELNDLKNKNNINVMEGFQKDDIAITGFNKTDDKYIIKVQLKVKFYDYVTTIKGTIIEGKKDKLLVKTYNLEYSKGINDTGNYKLSNKKLIGQRDDKGEES